ncbi:unnamed protein product [Oikopleura dioica]|uniref:DUF218 domain-containing protein n=1 Tax=Oikopleura dioica TaxID=34765 RepID=E4XVB7_OIKDI|nr:unnamed protein product [Oikopleura dioica]
MSQIAVEEFNADSTKIVLENKARNTVQNFQYGFEIIAQLCKSNFAVVVTIVTSDYHAARTFYVAHSVLRNMPSHRPLELQLEVASAFTEDREFRHKKLSDEEAKLESTVGYLLNKYHLKPLPQNYFLTALSMIENENRRSR